MKTIQNFLRDEDGAVTVDWVVLTAGVLLLAVAVGAAVKAPVNGQMTNIAAVIDAAG